MRNYSHNQWHMFYYKRKKEAYVLLGDKCWPTPNPKKKKGDYYNEYICHKYQGKDKSI